MAAPAGPFPPPPARPAAGGAHVSLANPASQFSLERRRYYETNREVLLTAISASSSCSLAPDRLPPSRSRCNK